jgi:hypothetical protein
MGFESRQDGIVGARTKVVKYLAELRPIDRLSGRTACVSGTTVVSRKDEASGGRLIVQTHALYTASPLNYPRITL